MANGFLSTAKPTGTGPVHDSLGPARRPLRRGLFEEFHQLMELSASVNNWTCPRCSSVAPSLISAIRSVMLEGIPVTALGVELIIVAVWTVLSFALALRWFRWS